MKILLYSLLVTSFFFLIIDIIWLSITVKYFYRPQLGNLLTDKPVIWAAVLFYLIYSLGLAIPFILSGYYMNHFLITRKGFGKYYNRVTKTGGIILLITGFLILTNQIQVISYYILTTFPFLTTFG